MPNKFLQLKEYGKYVVALGNVGGTGTWEGRVNLKPGNKAEGKSFTPYRVIDPILWYHPEVSPLHCHET